MPRDVADRLDETLAALVAEREEALLTTEHTATGRVVPVRPSWMPRLAAAAAVLVVLGFGGVIAASVGHRTGHPASTTGSAAEGSASASTPSSPTSSPTSSASSSAGSSTRSSAGSLKGAASAGLLRLTSAGFARELGTLGVPTARAPARLKADTSPPSGSPQALRAGCPGPHVRDGSQVSAVLVDGAPAVLVVHPPKAGGRLVEAWSCDGAHRLASATLAP